MPGSYIHAFVLDTGHQGGTFMFNRLVKGLAFTPLLFFLVGFREEIGIFVRWLYIGYLPMPLEVAAPFRALSANIGYFIIAFLVWLFIAASRTIFPVTTPGEVFSTAFYSVLHFLGLDGLAAYVRNGRFKAYVDELHRQRPGAVLVDFNSAIAVERIVLRPGLSRLLTNLFRGLTALLGFRAPETRIRGAGLTFLLPDERVHGVNDLNPIPYAPDDPYWMERILGVVDLRPQFRTSARPPHPLSKRLGTSVRAYTRDGIEVETTIFVRATLGEDPTKHDPLNVTYIGELEPENLRVIKITTQPEQPGQWKVDSFSDDLDAHDRQEIHETLKLLKTWKDYQTPQPAPEGPALPEFDTGRVFAAVYARARHHNGLGAVDEIVPWIDLPVHVAVDLFREIISHYNYDEIYRPNARGRVLLDKIRSELSTAMRNNGTLAWRAFRHRAHVPLQEGMSYPVADLQTYPDEGARAFQNGKVLRDRGIRVLGAGFSDLAVDERIYKQRLDSWRAAWDKETEISEAEVEWESVRVRTHVRMQAQQEFIQSLCQIYKSDATTREVLALRVLQALESAALDPKTRQLLPEDTFSMLRSIHDWLLPQDMGYGPSS
jgi:hypothetical protein